MTKPLKWTDKALEEYDALLDYLYENWGAATLIRVSDEINKTISHIHQNPDRYPIAIKSKGIRKCVASPQTSIFYKIFVDRIEVTSIFNNRQNPRRIRKLK